MPSANCLHGTGGWSQVQKIDWQDEERRFFWRVSPLTKTCRRIGETVATGSGRYHPLPAWNEREIGYTFHSSGMPAGRNRTLAVRSSRREQSQGDEPVFGIRGEGSPVRCRHDPPSKAAGGAEGEIVRRRHQEVRIGTRWLGRPGDYVTPVCEQLRLRRCHPAGDDFLRGDRRLGVSNRVGQLENRARLKGDG